MIFCFSSARHNSFKSENNEGTPFSKAFCMYAFTLDRNSSPISAKSMVISVQ